MNPQPHNFSLPAALCLLASLFLCAGCETELGGLPPAKGQSRASRMGLRNEAVPSSDVPRHKAWADAEMIANRENGRAPLVGGGVSMNPVYGDNTMLVVKPLPYDQLEPGMTVVYRNAAGRRVAHQLISKERHGWRSQGINNADADQDLVTPENYIGVVYISLAAEEPLSIP